MRAINTGLFQGICCTRLSITAYLMPQLVQGPPGRLETDASLHISLLQVCLGEVCQDISLHTSKVELGLVTCTKAALEGPRKSRTSSTNIASGTKLQKMSQLCSATEIAVHLTTRTQATGPVYGRQATRTAMPQHLLPVLRSFRAAGRPDLFLASPFKLNISAYAMQRGGLYKGTVNNTRHQLLSSMWCSTDVRLVYAQCNRRRNFQLEQLCPASSLMDVPGYVNPDVLEESTQSQR